MAMQSPPFAEQNASHSAALFRQAVSSMLYRPSGQLGQADMAVKAQTSPNMSVQVLAGGAWVAGTAAGNLTGLNYGTQSSYFALNDAPVTLTISTADPTNPRWDLVYCQILDTAFSGGSNTAVLGVVTGTPAGTPAVPAVPANALALGKIQVTAGATQITSGNLFGIDPLNPSAIGSHQQVYARSSTLVGAKAQIPSYAATSPPLGQMFAAADTSDLWMHLGLGQWWSVGNLAAPLGGTVYQSVQQTGLAASTFITVTCDTLLSGLGAGISDGVGIVAPASGYYLICGSIAVTDVPAGSSSIEAGFLVNGAGVATSFGGQNYALPGTGEVTIMPIGTRLMNLNAGDQVRLSVAMPNTFSTSCSPVSNTSFLTVIRLGGGVTNVA